MTKEGWISRCASRLRERGGMDQGAAQAYAEMCYDSQEDVDGPEAYTPEEVADEEMSLWDEPITDQA